MSRNRVVLLVLVPLIAGCSLPRERASLAERIDRTMQELAAEQRAIPPGDLGKAVAEIGMRRLREIEDAIGRGTTAEELATLRRRFERAQDVHVELRALLAMRERLAREMELLRERYRDSESPAERSLLRALDAESARQSAFVLPKKATPEEALEALDFDVANTRRAIDDHSKGLPHAAEARAKLAARIEGMIPLAKARLESANKEQKPLLGQALALLEGALPRAGEDRGVADPHVVQELARIADSAEAMMLEAAGAVELKPSPWFRMHTGFATLSPYVVRPANQQGDPPNAKFVLDESSSSPSFYVETGFLHRWAWLRDEDRTLPSRTGVLGDLQWLAPTDHEIRLRFTDSDEIKDSKAAASGDWSAEASVGWSMFEYEVADPRQRRSMTDPRGSLNFELNAGFATDRGSVDVHGYVQGGLGSVWSFPIEVRQGVFMPATFFGGIYYGVHSFPRLDTDDAVYTDSKRPYFNDLGALGIKIDVVYPLSESVEFVAGGRLAGRFENDAPEDWSLFVGVSLPIGKLFGGATGGQ